MDTVKTGEMTVRRGPSFRLLLRPVVSGGLSALALLVFYLGIITLAQGWDHAIQQLGADLWFVIAIMAGFGTQVGLYTYLHTMHLHTDEANV